MLKKLKTRFILITMSLITFVLLIIFIGIYFFMAQTEERQTIMQMEALAKKGTFPSPPMPPIFNNTFSKNTPSPFTKRIEQDSFIVTLDSAGTIKNISFPYALVDESVQINVLVTRAKALSSVQGILTYNQTQVRYFRQNTPTGSIYIFTDRTDELATLNRLKLICLTISVLSFCSLFVMTLYLSKWAIKPISIAWEKQKQFVTNASHELKTPLTVIATNTDVILANPEDSVQAQSKWLYYIKAETERLTLLVGELLSLARLDDKEATPVKTTFNVSESIMNVCLPFESVIFEEGKYFDITITPNLNLHGNENRIKQLVIILIDNAVKNTPIQGKIHIKLCREASKLYLSITNTGPGISKLEHTKIFERFYRVDTSRARETGGYGLGLAIAKSIVELHNGTIEVNSLEEGPTTFLVILPYK